MPTSRENLSRSVDFSRLVVRPAQVRDLNSLADVLTDSFHPPEGWDRFWYPFLRLGIYEDLRLRFRSSSPGYACLVAVVPVIGDNEEVLVGTVEIGLRATSWQLGAPSYPYLSNLAVHTPYRRKGVARQLLLSCERKAIEWGFRHLYLHVLEDNEQAKNLYLSSGYSVQRTESSYGALLFNRPRRVFLRKQIR